MTIHSAERKSARSEAVTGGGSAQNEAGPEAPIRRIATEEAFCTPAVVSANRQLAHGLWNQADLLSTLKVQSEPVPELYHQLLDFEHVRLETMDRDGVDMHVLSLTAPGVQLFEASAAASLVRDSNDVLADVVRKRPDRFAGLASFAPQNPAVAVKEMERAIVDLGLNGFIVNSHTNDEYLDQQRFWPIFEAAEALDRPIYLHPRCPSAHMIKPYLDAGLEGGIWGFQAETGLHALRLIMAGVFERFQRLQIVLGHMGEGLPYNLWRIDYMAEKHKARFAKRSLTPSETFRRNFTITTSGVEHPPTLRYAIEVLGIDRVMWAIDWPYQVSANAVAFIDAAPLSLHERRSILQTNAERVFHLVAAHKPT